MIMKDSKDNNPFKLINKIDELPSDLKQQVMGTIKFVHLASDVGKLFTLDMARAFGKMIDLEMSDNNTD